MKIELLRDLCAAYWNPIGVPMENEVFSKTLAFPPLPSNEYDPYLEHLLSMVKAGRSNDEMVDYLRTVEVDYMGLSNSNGDKVTFVKAVQKAFTVAP